MSCSKHSALSNFNNIFLLLYLTRRTLIFVTIVWCIGKDQKYSIIGCRCPQSGQAPSKRKAPKSTKTQLKRQKTVPSSPPRPASPIQATPSSPPHPVPQTQEVPSPPQSAPQAQAGPADVSGPITDPIDLDTSSAVRPKQPYRI